MYADSQSFLFDSACWASRSARLIDACGWGSESSCVSAAAALSAWASQSSSQASGTLVVLFAIVVLGIECLTV